ncbi:MAG: DUF2007 domain-containing protein, partial [bacterium]|nr:DUF2007 domain-containing protein [bacterium]
CRGEFVDEVTTCPDCGTPLVSELPEEKEVDEPFVKVFRSADASLLPVIKSVLSGAGIPYVIQGEEAQGLYPFGSLGGGQDKRLLGAVVLVPETRREAAETVLVEFGEAVGSEDHSDDG